MNRVEDRLSIRISGEKCSDLYSYATDKVSPKGVV
jgi:hypothetical protein